MIRLYLLGGAVVAVMAFLGWWRWDAGQDAERALKAAQDRARIENLRDARARHEKTNNLSDDDLRGSLIRRVQPSGPQ